MLAVAVVVALAGWRVADRWLPERLYPPIPEPVPEPTGPTLVKPEAKHEPPPPPVTGVFQVPVIDRIEVEPCSTAARERSASLGPAA